MNLLDEEKNDFDKEKENEQFGQRYRSRDDKSASRFSYGPESSSSRYETDPLSDYGPSASKIVDDPDYKKNSKGPLFLLLFAIVACAFVAWYFLVGPGEKKAETSSIKTLFDQPITTADSLDTEMDSTLETETVPKTVTEEKTLTAPYQPGAGKVFGSAQNFGDIFSATIQALPAGSYPSLLTFNQKGYFLIEIYAATRADLANFIARFESASAPVKLKPNFEGQANFAGKSFYRGSYSGEVNLSASRSGSGAGYLGVAELKTQLRQFFTDAGMRNTNVEERPGRSGTNVRLRSTGTRATITKALSAMAKANLSVYMNKANVTFDTTEPINDYAVVSMWLQVAQP